MESTWIIKDKQTGNNRILSPEELEEYLEKFQSDENQDSELLIEINDDEVQEETISQKPQDAKIINIQEDQEPIEDKEISVQENQESIKHVSELTKEKLANIKYDAKKIVNKSLNGVKQKLEPHKRTIEVVLLASAAAAVVLVSAYIGTHTEIIIREKNPDNIYSDIIELGNPINIVSDNTIYSSDPNMYCFNNIGMAREIDTYGDAYFKDVVSIVYANEVMQANLDYNWETMWGFLKKGNFEDWLKDNNMTIDDFYNLGMANTAKIQEALVNDYQQRSK